MARDKRFIIEEALGGWVAHCTWCGTSSPAAKSKHKAVRWSQRHAIAEMDLDLPSMVQYMRGR